MPIFMESGKQTCLICLRNNYDESSLILYDMCTMEMGNGTYLNKLEFVLNAEIVVYDSTLICHTCLNDLNNAFDFKERVNKALEYWSVRFEEGVNIEKSNDMIGLINEGNINDEIPDNCTEVRVIEISESATECAQQPNALNETPLNNVADTTNNDAASLNNDNNEDNILEPYSFECYKCNDIFLTALELINHSCSSFKVVEKVEDTAPQKSDGKVEQESDPIHPDFTRKSTTQNKLNKHRKTKHRETSVKKFVCTYCNHSFKQSYHLREHLTSHTGEHNFICDVCGKTFQRISSQRRHMKTHEALPGQKSKKSPFLCNICGKRFPYSNGAQRHMRIHTGDRRYECDVCNKKFSQSTHLKVHQRTHTGERPYKCGICEESFTLKYSLHKHVRKGHNESKESIKILDSLEPDLCQPGAFKEEEDIVKKDDFLVGGILYDP